MKLAHVSGERYDVVIRTNQPVATYLIHLKALGECIETNAQVYQEALLRYEGAELLQEVPTLGYTGLPDGRVSFNVYSTKDNVLI